MYTQTKKLSEDLNKLWGKGFHRYSYQPVKNAVATWWILDCPDKAPVNRHRAKVQVNLINRQREFFVGWGVEKGFTPADPLTSKHDPLMIMDQSWHWHALLQAAMEGSLVEALKPATATPNKPLVLSMDFWFWREKVQYTEQMMWEVLPDGRVRFMPERHERSDTEVAVLSPALVEAQTVKEVFKGVATTPSLPIQYGDVYFGHLYSAAEKVTLIEVIKASLDPWANLVSKKLEFEPMLPSA